MDHDVLLRILGGLAADRDAGQSPGSRLVSACVDALHVTGAGIMLMVDEEQRGSFGGSDDAIRIAEELQFTLGEGPCIDSCRTGRPVAEPNLGNPAKKRWPGFSDPAVAAGIRSIFGFPLQVGGICIGALDLYSNEPGDLSADQYQDAIVMADVVTHAVLELQAGADPGALAHEIDPRVDGRMVVHQAAGMLSAQLTISIVDAMKLLRRRAVTAHLPLGAISRQVVGREVQLSICQST